MGGVGGGVRGGEPRSSRWCHGHLPDGGPSGRRRTTHGEGPSHPADDHPHPEMGRGGVEGEAQGSAERDRKTTPLWPRAASGLRRMLQGASIPQVITPSDVIIDSGLETGLRGSGPPRLTPPGHSVLPASRLAVLGPGAYTTPLQREPTERDGFLSTKFLFISPPGL